MLVLFCKKCLEISSLVSEPVRIFSLSYIIFDYCHFFLFYMWGMFVCTYVLMEARGQCGCLSQSLSALFFETGILTDSGAC